MQFFAALEVIAKLLFWFLKRRDPTFVERFNDDTTEMDKAIVERDGGTVSVKYSELFKQARRGGSKGK